MATTRPNSNLSRRDILRFGAAAVGGMALVACGHPSAATHRSTSTSTPTSTTVSKSTSSPAVHPTIRLVGNFPGATDATVAAALSKAFTQANPRIEVHQPTAGAPPAQKLLTLIEAGQAPDFFTTSDEITFGLYDNNALVDLTPYVNTTQGKALMADIPAGIIAGEQIPGGALPGIAYKADPSGIYYNADMFQSKHVSVPAAGYTWNDFRTMMQQVADPANNVYGTSGDMYSIALEVAPAWGTEWIPADNPTTLNYNQLIVQGITLIQNMRYVDNTFMPGRILNWNTSFPNGQLATLRQGSYSLAAYAGAIKNSFSWNTAPEPAGPAGVASSLSTQPWSIVSSTKQPDACWQVILFGHSEAFWNLVIPGSGDIPPQKSMTALWRSIMGKNPLLSHIDLTSWTDPVDNNTGILQPVFKYFNQKAWNPWSNAVSNCLTGTPPVSGDQNVASQFQAASVQTAAYENAVAAVWEQLHGKSSSSSSSSSSSASSTSTGATNG